MAQQVRPEVRVAVCGGSLYMAGLAASLEAIPGVAVLRPPASGAALAQALEHLSLAVIAFDLGEIPGDLAFSLLRDRPDLILIGIDPSDDKALVLSGRAEQPLSAAELVQMITDFSAVAGGPTRAAPGAANRLNPKKPSNGRIP